MKPSILRRAWAAASVVAIRFAFIALVVVTDSGTAVANAALASVPARVPAKPSGDRTRTLVVFGDRLAYGYKSTPGNGWSDIVERRLAARAPGTHVLNRSVSGSHVRNVMEQVERVPGFMHVQAVVVMAGGNDLMNVTEPLRLARDEAALLSRIRERFPTAKILVANVADLSWRAFHLQPGKPAMHLPLVPQLGLSMLDDVDNAVIARSAQRFGASLLDLHSLVSSGNGHLKGTSRLSLDAFDEEYISDDGLHPNDRGYSLLADYAWPQVARAMGVAP